MFRAFGGEAGAGLAASGRSVGSPGRGQGRGHQRAGGGSQGVLWGGTRIPQPVCPPVKRGAKDTAYVHGAPSKVCRGRGFLLAPGLRTLPASTRPGTAGRQRAPRVTGESPRCSPVRGTWCCVCCCLLLLLYFFVLKRLC